MKVIYPEPFNKQVGINFLNSIRQRLYKDGWRQGGNLNRGSKCLLDTISAVWSEHQTTISLNIMSNVEDILRTIILADNGSKFSGTLSNEMESVSIIRWNDYKHRKFKDVINLIDAAISMLNYNE